MDFKPPYKPATWYTILCLVVALVVLALVLFLSDRCGGYFASHDIGKARANVNAGLSEVNAAKQGVANDRVDEAVALDHVKQAANEVIAASNATDQAKTEANKALANYQIAVNANVPTGTTAEDLQRKLEALDR
jgi:hypothetical protein